MFALRRSAAASSAFGAAVAAAHRSQPSALVGVEHEFRVLDDGRPIDARTLIHGLGPSQRDLDPSDPYAYRLPDGSVVTCDGNEIEIAIPPVPVGPGFAAAAEARLAALRGDLEARLGGQRTLVGYSTHLSISVPDERLAHVVSAFVRHYAAAQMLLLDGAQGVGLLVRPRPGRLELGGAYATDRALRTALVFAVGATLECLARTDVGEGSALPVLAPRVEPARDRFGVYVDRTAFGGDLYVSGRETALPLRGGGLTDAQTGLARTWAAARATLAGRVGGPELDEVDAVVAGRQPLPCEYGADIRSTAGTRRRPTQTAYGLALAARQRPDFALAPVMLTWQLAVFLVAGQRRVFAAVPGSQLAGFLIALDAGELDASIASYLGQRGLPRTMSHPEQARVAGLWDRIGARRRLLPLDPPPMARGQVASLVNAAGAH